MVISHTLLDVSLNKAPVLSCRPQVNDPALRGGSLFPSQLPGMDMIKQEGDAPRVRAEKQAVNAVVK